jgi:hypothetical protein
VDVASLEGRLELPGAHFTLVRPNLPPDPPRPFSVDIDMFEALARRLQSPLFALQELGLADMPPRLQLLDVSTDFIDLGNECGGTASRVEFWFFAQDDRGEENLLVNAFWTLNQQRSTIDLEYMEGGVYRGEVGDLEQTGTLLIYITAQDSAGQQVQLPPVEVEVGFCIG